MNIILLNDLCKTYTISNPIKRTTVNIEVLKGINLSIKKNEMTCIMGESGCGKTTLLKMMGGMEIPSGGEVYYEGNNINDPKTMTIEEYRRTKIGFVFQDYKLIETMSVRENILLPQIFAHKNIDTALKKVERIAKMVDLYNKLDSYPYEISGGQKQRVAICRALINDPEVILADEPTGNLDAKSARAVMELFLMIKEKLKKTLVIVTHDDDIADYAERKIEMVDGKLVNC